MAQGVGLAAGIPEGHVPKLDLIVPVPALFHRQAALVHGVGDVQIPEALLEEGSVVFRLAQKLEQGGEIVRHQTEGGHILGDGPHAEGPRQRLQPHKGVGRSGKGGGDRRGRRRQQAHGSPGQPGEGALGEEGRGLVAVVGGAEFLLPVDPHVRRPLPVESQEAVEPEEAVGQGVVVADPGPVAVGLGVEGRGGGDDEEHQRRHGRQVHRGAQKGVRAAGGRRGGKEGEGHGRAAQQGGDGPCGLHRVPVQLVQAPAAAPLVRPDVRVELLGLGIVGVGKVHVHLLLGEDEVLLEVPQLLPGGLDPAEEGRHQRNGGGGEQGDQHPVPKGGGVPVSRQLPQDAGGKVDAQVGGQSLPGRQGYLGRHGSGTGLQQQDEATAVQAEALPPGEGVFLLRLLHGSRPPSGSTCSGSRRAGRTGPPGPAGTRGCPPRRCGGPPGTAPGRRTGWRPSGG